MAASMASFASNALAAHAVDLDVGRAVRIGRATPEEGLSLEAVDSGVLMRALEKCNWNQTQAATYLDISRRTLIYRIEKYRLERG